ncbi:UPF0158 family protein [Selenomonas ruminantium]|jgi:uncharacterized protein YrzB (UPF0473 family)|uniref:Uncharacterized protein family (UPF0158) n=1 Tax=Selenomonas ruminantium TaxID=971 RepID=A0A1K1M3F2_SELRU|nr:UPF0158 family protein [Selenomonas ruminantium]SFW16478.1 Uncharacterised protein family (UPF0158) [Selenomonas ruminantium]
MKVNLQELAKALAQSDMHQGYIDIESGRVILMQDDLGEEEALNHVFEIEDDWEHYIPLPNAVDSEEHNLMESFAAAQREDVKERLQEILQKSGAQIKFRQQIKHLLLKPAWEKFQQEYFLNVARDYCEENDLEYEEQ